MRGLLAQAMTQPPEQAPTEPLQESPPEQQDENLGEAPQAFQAAEDSQETYNLISGQMQNHVWGEGYDGITQVLSRSGDVVMHMAQVISNVLQAIAQSAASKGKTLQPKTLVQSAMDLAVSISEIAQKLGKLDQQTEAAATQKAFYRAMSIFRERVSEEVIPPETSEQVADYLEQIEQRRQSSLPKQEDVDAKPSPSEKRPELHQVLAAALAILLRRDKTTQRTPKRVKAAVEQLADTLALLARQLGHKDVTRDQLLANALVMLLTKTSIQLSKEERKALEQINVKPGAGEQR